MIPIDSCVLMGYLTRQFVNKSSFCNAGDVILLGGGVCDRLNDVSILFVFEYFGLQYSVSGFVGLCSFC